MGLIFLFAHMVRFLETSIARKEQQLQPRFLYVLFEPITINDFSIIKSNSTCRIFVTNEIHK